MKPGGWRHSEETRARIRAIMGDPARRAEISEKTKARMADPAVRQRIKDGMRKWASETDELRTLRGVWRGTSPAARRRFLAELLQPLCVDAARGISV